MDILLEKSLVNVHCKGMDSLVVKDAPGMVRIFVARLQVILKMRKEIPAPRPSRAERAYGEQQFFHD